jgi:hypothetical protein
MARSWVLLTSPKPEGHGPSTQINPAKHGGKLLGGVFLCTKVKE